MFIYSIKGSTVVSGLKVNYVTCFYFILYLFCICWKYFLHFHDRKGLKRKEKNTVVTNTTNMVPNKSTFVPTPWPASRSQGSLSHCLEGACRSRRVKCKTAAHVPARHRVIPSWAVTADGCVYFSMCIIFRSCANALVRPQGSVFQAVI